MECGEMYNCCDCGGSEDGHHCGCSYCWSCNACDNCKDEDEVKECEYNEGC